MAPSSERIQIRTTLPVPLPSITTWPDMHTRRLLIRAPRESDITGFHSMRLQPEVMRYSVDGRITPNEEASVAKLKTFLPPNDTKTSCLFIFERQTGDFIGNIGISLNSFWFGWPEIGYSIKREAWGNNYAVEVMAAVLEGWWKLPRAEVEIEVDVESLKPGEVGDGVVAAAGGVAAGDYVVEQLTAMVEGTNVPSTKLLDRSGYRVFKKWDEKDNREGYGGRDVVLLGYSVSDPAKREG